MDTRFKHLVQTWFGRGESDLQTGKRNLRMVTVPEVSFVVESFNTSKNDSDDYAVGESTVYSNVCRFCDACKAFRIRKLSPCTVPSFRWLYRGNDDRSAPSNYKVVVVQNTCKHPYDFEFTKAL